MVRRVDPHQSLSTKFMRELGFVADDAFTNVLFSGGIARGIILLSLYLGRYVSKMVLMNYYVIRMVTFLS